MKVSFRTRLLTGMLMVVMAPFLGVAGEIQRGQKVPDTFSYPESQEIIQVDAEIRSRSLSGVVRDPGGAVASKVLVERVRSGWGKRIGAVLSDAKGRFTFSAVTPGTYFLRVSKPGFNTLLLTVRVSTKARSTLRIELQLSH
jgi:hypothetical protein